jgi:hypothetical protein
MGNKYAAKAKRLKKDTQLSKKQRQAKARADRCANFNKKKQKTTESQVLRETKINDKVQLSKEEKIVRNGSESTSEDSDNVNSDLVEKINNAADLSILSSIEKDENNIDSLLFTQQQSPIQSYSSQINTPLIKSKTATPVFSPGFKEARTTVVNSVIRTPKSSSQSPQDISSNIKSSTKKMAAVSTKNSAQKSEVKEKINNEVESLNTNCNTESLTSPHSNGNASSDNESEVHIETPRILVKLINRKSTRNKGVEINYNLDNTNEFIIGDENNEKGDDYYYDDDDDDDENDYIGREIKKFFPSEKIYYRGVVQSYDDDKDGDRYYKIKYIDDDEEEFDIKDLLKCLMPKSKFNNENVTRSTTKQKVKLSDLLDKSEKWRSNVTVSLPLNKKRKNDISKNSVIVEENSKNSSNESRNQVFKKSKKSTQSNKNIMNSNNNSRKIYDPLSWISSYITPSVRQTLIELEREYKK